MSKETEINLSEESKEITLPDRLVVKFGTNSLCSNEGEKKLDQEIFNDFARQIVELWRQGVKVVIVSSGAKQSGEEYARERGINIESDPSSVRKQVLAAMGQHKLMERWGRAIEDAGGKGVAQLLVTYANWTDDTERNSIVGSINSLLENGVTVVINENDPVADQEMRKWGEGISENDCLARMVAIAINANAILFLTDEGGIYTSDPKNNPQAKRFKEISPQIPNSEEELVVFERSKKGEGQGMATKLREASRCFLEGGMMVAIADRKINVISRFVRGENVGTKIGEKTRLASD